MTSLLEAGPSDVPALGRVLVDSSPSGLEIGVAHGADTARLTRELGDALAGRGYPSLELTTRIYPEATHFTVPALLLGHGLRAVFAAERDGIE
jgi:hypothetical protein